MKGAIKSTRNLGRVMLLTLVGLTGWFASPAHFWSWLEPTAHAATFTVTTTADNGNDTNPTAGSLRKAIKDANNSAGLDTITFNISGAGVKTISPPSALPPIFDAVIIDGNSQPGFVSQPLIELNGASAGSNGYGLQITAGNSLVRGLVINRFIGSGIRLSQGGSNIVSGCYIGTNAAGTADMGNTGAGINISNSPNNIIGRTIFGGPNVISGNGGGIDISGLTGENATGNIVAGNFIGTDVTGTLDVGNSGDGVRINSVLNAASNNTIGGTASEQRNIISGNSGNGVWLIGIGVGAGGNQVQGNYIGTKANGTEALPNTLYGVLISDTDNNTIGGTTTAARNVISGNNGGGISIGFSSGTQVQGNYIGIDAGGAADLGNNAIGVILLNGASNNIIGGTTTAARNVISGNNGGGVSIGGNGNKVQGNFIGTNAAGTAAVPNFRGVFVDGVNNTLGGTAAGARNVISGNSGINVSVVTSDPNTRVQGNYIGTDSSGTVAIFNTFLGVNIDGGENITIGGTEAGAGNVISGHVVGIFIRGTAGGGTGNKIQGNLIGTNAAGTAAVPNGTGVEILNASGNTIGGTVAAARNVISGNGSDGIQINGNISQGNQVQGNLIGTDVNGTVALPNTLNGVIISDAPNNTIGGTTSGARNIVSGNVRGVNIQGTNATGNQVQGNFIGTNAAGTSALPNTFDGVLINAPNNTVGGTMPAARNLISGNGTNGVGIDGNGATGNKVQGNFIGTKPNGTEALPNGSNGVRIDDASANTVGGTTATPGAAPGNLISGNQSNGLYIFGATATLNVVQGNLFGTDIAGTADLGNNDNGVFIEQGKQNTVGGTVPGARNIISGNNANGVEFADGAEENVVRGNLIGTNAAGTAALANSLEGVRLTAPKNIIGGTTPEARNVISGNSRDGIRISGAAATENQIQGNFLGTRADGAGQLGNAVHGVHINDNASKNTIGGAAAGAGNTIAFNSGDGVFIQPGNAATKDNAVLSNSIFSNTGLGIDLFPDGVTANDAGDADTGANNLQNFPALTSAISFPSATTAAGTLNSTANTAIRLEFFSNTSCDASGNGEGQTFIGSINVTTDAGGNASFTAAALTAVPAGRFITATATDPTGNTSEFSQCLQARAASSDLSINMFDSPDPVAAGSTLTYTITLTNSGPDRAEAVVVTDNLPTEVAFISCSSTGGGVCGGAGNNRTVTFSTLAAAEMVSVTLVTGVNSSVSGGTISNTATVNSATSDPNAANNSVTITTTVPATPTPTPTPTPVTLQFSAASYSVVEDCTGVTITVTRSGPVTGAATVDYATANATASERSDYTTALGTLRFAAGETSKTFDLLINEDSYVEGTETATIMLSNPAGAILGNPSTATLEIVDDASEPATNPIDQAQNFACQHYHDFLNRQPDAAGLAFWTDQITQCGTDAQCIEIKRINVSAAFFLSIEFQETGYLVYRFHQSAFGTGPLLRLRDFLADTQEIGRGVVVGATGWEQQLEANKQAYANAYAARPQFVAQYPASLTAAQFVDALNANTLDPQNPGTGGSLSQSERDQLVAELDSGAKTRAQVVRAVAEDAEFRAREFNRAFVYMQYVGYLRRNADDPPDNNLDGYNFWLGKLNEFNGNFVQAEMVKAFIVSSEYRRRFAN